tara:strand:+ start:2116 stop:3354 length:1239 start_codon:yes stop_codon:yes gene_type:complete
MELRNYQKRIVHRAKRILEQHRFVYLAMEVRTGKTLTSLSIAEEMGVNSVLFLTKKKALTSISEDAKMLCPSYEFFAINYESMHKLPKKKWDLVILDEAHGLGAFPKPSKRAKDVRNIIRGSYVILLSGTPTPESYSQMYHQVYGIPSNPFRSYKNFYRFCDDYVDVKTQIVNSLPIKFYNNGLPSILTAMQPYMISFSQREAGFKSDLREHILRVPMEGRTYDMCKRLRKDRVIDGKDEVVLADTPVKLMQKLHQMYSGTVKFESGKAMVFDHSKAQFIYDRFCRDKIGIFYKFKAELEALKNVYGDELTTELKEFEEGDKSIALQIVSGREGISLRQASALVYYNIDFSATSYWQSRDRMTTKDRTESDIYWVFAEKGIESQVYKAVTEKKDYTLNHFKKWNTTEILDMT